MGEYMGTGFKKCIFDYSNIGKIKNADIEYEYKSKSCSDNFKIYIKLDNKKEKVLDVKYEIFGCVAIMAGSSVTCKLIKNKTIKEILTLKDIDILSNFDEYPDERLDCILKMKECIINDIFVNYAQK